MTETPHTLAVEAILARFTAGEASAEITLMHLLLAAGTLSTFKELIRGLAASGTPSLVSLSDIARSHSVGLARTAALIEAGLVDADGPDRLAAIRDQYDRAVAIAPEASVALYSLGDAAVLEKATGELASLLAQWRLLGPDVDVLDVGCGIGRLERALAGHVARITGIDLSPGMIGEARRRCRGIANATFLECSGRDLGQFSDRSFDLVVAVDSSPYLFEADPGIAARHVHEAARVLREGGRLAIFNYSYRGDLALDRADVAGHAAAAGLRIVRNGTCDLRLWDGAAFLLERQAA